MNVTCSLIRTAPAVLLGALALAGAAPAQQLLFDAAAQAPYTVTGALPGDVWRMLDSSINTVYRGAASQVGGGAVEIDLGRDAHGEPHEIRRIILVGAQLPAGAVLSIGGGGRWIPLQRGPLARSYFEIVPPPLTRGAALRLELPAGAAFALGGLRADAPRSERYLAQGYYRWYGQPARGTRLEYAATILDLEPGDDFVQYFATAGFPALSPPLILPGWHGALQLQPAALIHLASVPAGGVPLWAWGFYFQRDPSFAGLDFRLQAAVLDIDAAGALQVYWTRVLRYIG